MSTGAVKGETFARQNSESMYHYNVKGKSLTFAVTCDSASKVAEIKLSATGPEQTFVVDKSPLRSSSPARLRV